MRAAKLCVFLLLGGSLFALAGCGRKGDLETPYQAAVEARKEAERRKEPVPPEPTPPVQDRPFILDKLL